MDVKDIYEEELKQVQMNRLYESVVKEYLDEIEYGKTNSAIANRILVLIRNGLDNEGIAVELESDEWIDWSPWFIGGVPYKAFIVADYYRWREHYKKSGTLINPFTGKKG